MSTASTTCSGTSRDLSRTGMATRSLTPLAVGCAGPGNDPVNFLDRRGLRLRMAPDSRVVPTLNPLPLPLGGVESLDRRAVRALLDEARLRTLALVSSVSEDDMNRVHDPLMSPLVWDLGHIAAFEDLWLGMHVGGLPALRPELLSVYDATDTPRAERGDIPYLRLDEAYVYLAVVRRRALRVLEQDDFEPFVWDMVIRHEQQHNETMLQTLKLAAPGVFTPPARALPARPPFYAAGRKVLVEAGPFELGAPDGGFAYDNERPRQVVDLPA